MASFSPAAWGSTGGGRFVSAVGPMMVAVRRCLVLDERFSADAGDHEEGLK
jgi:hypothetical protein